MAKSARRREEASFGFRDVAMDEKQGLVDAVFDKVAARYDLMNDLMSGGLHRLWKEALVAWLMPPRRTRVGYRVLDLAGGTGDIAFRIAERSPEADILVADVNPEMLDVGRRKATAARYRRADRVHRGECGGIAVFQRSFRCRDDCLRDSQRAANRSRPGQAYRVLKPGGRFLCLEFSTVDIALLDRAYELYSFRVIPALGGLVIGDRQPYEYLVESIRKFPNQARFAAMISEAGFARVEHRNLSGGIAAIHSGWKI